jgi:hypothetical protein
MTALFQTRLEVLPFFLDDDSTRLASRLAAVRPPTTPSRPAVTRNLTHSFYSHNSLIVANTSGHEKDGSPPGSLRVCTASLMTAGVAARPAKPQRKKIDENEIQKQASSRSNSAANPKNMLYYDGNSQKSTTTGEVRVHLVCVVVGYMAVSYWLHTVKRSYVDKSKCEASHFCLFYIY